LSLSEILIKVGGVVLFIAGIALLLSVVGWGFAPISTLGPLWSIVAGFVFVGAGIYIVRGGTLTA